MGCAVNINNKYVDLDKKDMRYIYVKIRQRKNNPPPKKPSNLEAKTT